MRNSSIGAVVLATAVVCGAGGFAVGRLTSPADADHVGRAAKGRTRELDAGAANARLTVLERERDALRRRIAELSDNERVAVSPPGSGPVAASTTDPAAQAVTNPEPETMNAADTLAALQAAIRNGDADAVALLQASVTANDEALVGDLVAMLDTADSLFATEQLADLLGQLGDPRALPSLHNLLQRESDDAVRSAVVRALGLIPDESSVVLLSAEFRRESGSPMPPSLAATALGQIGSGTAIEALQQEIEKGTNGMVRAFALRALAGRKDPALVPFFFAQARRDGANDRSRKQAIEAIAATGARTAVPELESLAFSNEISRAVQESAKRAINQILGETRYQVR